MQQEDQYSSIDRRYSEYADAVSSEISEKAKEGMAWKIQEEVLKLKYQKYGQNIGYGKYSIEVFEKVHICLQSFPESKARAKGTPFSQYLCNAINKMIGYHLKKQALEEKNGGITISEHTLKMVSRLKKTLKRIDPNLTGELLVEEIAKSLGVKRNTAMRYLQIITARRTEAEPAAPQKQTDSREKQIEKLCEIEAAWKKKPDKMISEILTVRILKKNVDIEEDELNYGFIDTVILKEYFADPLNYKFPEEYEIAKKYGKSKSAASHALHRFLPDLKL
ncbi:hypothetical protein J6W78_03660 [bacterium]|nr:hypothetical protein [bacterium]